MKTYKIACIPGDGIGKEVVPAGQTVLAALAAASMTFKFDFENFGWAPMATPNCSTYGHPNCPRQDG